MNKSPVSVFGIRHHGPGSAANLLEALHRLNPDYILIEGPGDADHCIPLVTDKDMQPPVSLLVYEKDNSSYAAFYPFAEFSPEWQALRFALEHKIPVSFMDLPQAHQIAQKKIRDNAAETAGDAAAENTDSETGTGADREGNDDGTDRPDTTDPLDWFARQAGYGDGESWWEHAVEESANSLDIFRAITDMMGLLREQFPKSDDDPDKLHEDQREAWMRKTIRSVVKEGYTNIAAVCGAWHVSALLAEVKAEDDDKLLSSLPRVNVEATWIPWTYGRLARRSGYGAGISSPGWYHHLWNCRRGGDMTAVASRWIIELARLLREADLEVSSAHVIEAVRLAESLAALRERPFARLDELHDAAKAVLCSGDQTPLTLIHEKLYTGERMGRIPAGTPQLPLQTDIEKNQKDLRLKPSASTENLDLDLRTPLGLSRSILLHRLNLLNIPWGVLRQTDSRKKGTFHEFWQIKWEPEFAIKIIEASIWGSSVEKAATAKSIDKAGAEHGIPGLCALLGAVILSELPDAVQPIVAILRSSSAETSAVTALMEAVPSLVNVMRYGSVRKNDSSMVEEVVDGFVTRICIELPPACQSLDEPAAEDMNERISSVNHSLSLVQDDGHTGNWYRTLDMIMGSPGVNPLVRGRVCRLLFDARKTDSSRAAAEMTFMVSPGSDTAAASAWLQGFLEGSGMLLVHDQQLWNIVDTWVTGLTAERFITVLPLIRRTFSSFTSPERKQLGNRVKSPQQKISHAAGTVQAGSHLDRERADRAARTVASLLKL